MRARAVVLLVLALAVAGCTRSVDLTQAAKLTPITTGWFDAGVTEDGKNKLVPSLSFTLTNTGTAAWGSLQINCIFRRIGDSEEWSTVLVRGLAAGANDLAPGATTAPIVVRAPQGYTGTQPRAEILTNHLFVDAKVEVFGKSGSANWVKLGEFPITRQLLTK
jgi:hypothetical protein